jgi:hypothetical protein
MWEEYSGMKTLLADRSDKWFTSTTETVYQLYINVYRDNLAKENYKRAETLLTNAYRYTKDRSFLDAEKEKLAALILEANARLKAQEEEKNRVTETRQARALEQSSVPTYSNWR